MAEIRIFLAERLRLAVSEEKSGVHKASDGARSLATRFAPSTNRNPHRAIFYGRPDPAARTGGSAQASRASGQGGPVRQQPRMGRLEPSVPGSVPRSPSPVTWKSSSRSTRNGGVREHYALADDVKRKLNKAGYFALMSCLKTIAAKHKSSVRTVATEMRQGTEFYVRFKVGISPVQSNSGS